KNGLRDSTELIDQLKIYSGSSKTFCSKITVNEPLSSKWNLVTEYSLNVNKSTSYRNSYDDKDRNKEYTDHNDLYSNNFDLDATSNSGTITARYKGSKFRRGMAFDI